jgi:capsular polysaccharide transport system ATP-binding protein
MISLRDVVKEYHTHEGPRRVLKGISCSLMKGEKLAVLGRNGAGKSTLIRLMGGVEKPTSGHIEFLMSLSWPIGFAGGFHSNLTGTDNVRFICRIYDAPFDDVLAYVEDFAELGAQMRMPVASYSSGMRARLAFGLSLAIEFDCYLIDEVIMVGDQSFHRKCHVELFEKRRDRALIIASHSADIVREYCTQALILKDGRGKVFHDIDLALDIYSGL